MLHVACLICWAKTESMAQKVFCWIRMWTLWTNLSSRPIVLTTTKKSNISGKQLDFHEFIQPEKSYKKAIKKRIFTWTTGRTITTRWTVLAGCSCKPWLYTHTHTHSDIMSVSQMSVVVVCAEVIPGRCSFRFLPVRRSRFLCHCRVFQHFQDNLGHK